MKRKMINTLYWNMRNDLFATLSNGRNPITFEEFYGKYFTLKTLINRTYPQAVNLMRKYTRKLSKEFSEDYNCTVVPVPDESDPAYPIIGIKVADGGEEDTRRLKLSLNRRLRHIVDTIGVQERIVKSATATGILPEPNHTNLLVSRYEEDE